MMYNQNVSIIGPHLFFFFQGKLRNLFGGKLLNSNVEKSFIMCNILIKQFLFQIRKYNFLTYDAMQIISSVRLSHVVIYLILIINNITLNYFMIFTSAI